MRVLMPLAGQLLMQQLETRSQKAIKSSGGQTDERYLPSSKVQCSVKTLWGMTVIFTLLRPANSDFYSYDFDFISQQDLTQLTISTVGNTSFTWLLGHHIFLFLLLIAVFLISLFPPNCLTSKGLYLHDLIYSQDLFSLCLCVGGQGRGLHLGGCMAQVF